MERLIPWMVGVVLATAVFLLLTACGSRQNAENREAKNTDPARSATEISKPYVGNWFLVSMTLDVEIELWGKHCGPRPTNYSSDKKRAVQIHADGNHLVFSKGGLNTRKCGSPNSLMNSVARSVEEGRWHRVCVTKKGDPKFERGEYTLVAETKNRLLYEASTRFDWLMDHRHCIVSAIDKREYVR